VCVTRVVRRHEAWPRLQGLLCFFVWGFVCVCVSFGVCVCVTRVVRHAAWPGRVL
jgi:hypothetical protein